MAFHYEFDTGSGARSIEIVLATMQESLAYAVSDVEKPIVDRPLRCARWTESDDHIVDLLQDKANDSQKFMPSLLWRNASSERSKGKSWIRFDEFYGVLRTCLNAQTARSALIRFWRIRNPSAVNPIFKLRQEP